tara:strand:+ start:466 stop:1731 length:1266 start_codon:yes stop_codon:yes gene_type:complete
MTSLSGLKSQEFTDIDVLNTINLNGNAGSLNQVIKSDGVNSDWGDVSSLVSFERLTADGSTITIGGSLTGNYNTEIARTIAVAKVPNSLTAGTNISFSTGTTYDGSSAITINATDTNTQLNLTAGNGISIANTGGVNRTISAKPDEDTLDFDSDELAVQKVPNSLTAGTNISFSTGSTYDGSSAITINATDTNTTYQGSATINIDTATNPDTISCIKVPNTLTAGTNLSYSSGSTFDGGTARTINLSSAPTNLNLTNNNNIFHPANVFEVSGELRMSIELGNFLPNDDSSSFNIGVEDDGSTKIHGSIKVMSSSLEVCGYFIIPRYYTATGVRIDATNSSGSSVSRSIQVFSVTTYGGTGYTSLNFTGNTNAEFSLSPTMAGASDKIMLIKIFTTSTTDHIRGGYIKLTRASFSSSSEDDY